MSDRGDTRPPLAEDPRFLAGLSDLDNRLDVAQRPLRPAIVDLFPAEWLVTERPPEPLVAGMAAAPASANREASLPPSIEPVSLRNDKTFDGLGEKPFDLATDPTFLFHSQAHERVATALLTAIGRRDGICLLTGEAGIGKTTMCRAISGQLDRRIVPSIVLEPLADAAALVHTLLVDFGVTSRGELARAPRPIRGDAAATPASFFDSLASFQATAVVILDEADRQPPDVLEHLRALAAYGPSAGLLQIVLVAQPSFVETLRTPALRTLDASIARRLELAPLAADEIAGYIRHRLAVAGTNPRVGFAEPALRRIFDLSRGVPGIVNLLCDRALAGGFRRSADTIDAPLVAAAAASARRRAAAWPDRAVAPRAVHPLGDRRAARGGRIRRCLDVPRCARARGRRVGARAGAAGRADAAADRADPSARAAARQPSAAGQRSAARGNLIREGRAPGGRRSMVLRRER